METEIETQEIETPEPKDFSAPLPNYVYTPLDRWTAGVLNTALPFEDRSQKYYLHADTLEAATAEATERHGNVEVQAIEAIG